MNKTTIHDDIHMFTMNVDTMLFEGMWDLPHGVSMNSYVVKGEKTAIIDGVIGWDGVPKTLFDNLAEIGVDPKTIDYAVVNHMEPDHSGWIDDFKKIQKDFTIVTTAKGAELLESYYGNDVKVKVVEEGDTLDLGNGKVLSFHPSPNVHWPETMLTYEKSTKTLFSCDMFGAFGTLGEHIFDDQLTEEEKALYEEETMRYASNVMITYAPMLKRALRITKGLDIAMIAPGHGPLYRKNPGKIIDDYTRFTQFASGHGLNEVTILYGSMYGMTEKTVKHAEALLKEKGIKVNTLKLPNSTQSDMVLNAFKAAGIIVAGSTYEYKMYPPVAHAVDELGRKKIKNKTALHFGSYGWSGGAKKDLDKIFDTYKMNWDMVDSIEFPGRAQKADYEAIEKGVEKFVEAMQEKIV
ncbi:MAG: FprA family A-type flavoprotein [Bacillota bacterium]